MKQIIKKGSFLTLMFLLLGCLSLYAADNDLITRQITITLEKAGTLPDRIASSKKNKITNLKIIGEINGTDLRMIREMAGSNSNGNSTDGKLSVLDLSEAKIVKGGDSYYNDYNDNDYYTSNDVIGSEAFRACSGLTSLTLPAGITGIGDLALRGCFVLNFFYYYSCIYVIGSLAFSGCSGLTSLTLPAGITKIDFYTFRDCRGLTSLTLPASITSIGFGAFDSSGLTSIYVYAEKVPKGRNVFVGVDAKKCTLYVPKGTRNDYCASDFGNYIENIVEFDATGIDKITTSTDVEEVARYSVNGQRLSAPTKGLNIVKYSDGSVKKVTVQ